MSKRNRRSRSEFLHRRSLRVMGSAAAAPGRSLPVGARMSFWPSISRRAPVNIGTVSSSRLQRRPRCAAFAAGPARRHTCGAIAVAGARRGGQKRWSSGSTGRDVSPHTAGFPHHVPQSHARSRGRTRAHDAQYLATPYTWVGVQDPRRETSTANPVSKLPAPDRSTSPAGLTQRTLSKKRSRSWNRLTVRSSCVSEPVGNALICRIEDVHLLPSLRPNRGRPSAIHSARYASNETGGGAVLGLSSFPNS